MNNLALGVNGYFVQHAVCEELELTRQSPADIAFCRTNHLKKCGIIQGFWSVNPNPDDSGETIKQTDGLGFCRFDGKEDFKEKIKELLAGGREYFSSMQIQRGDERYP